MSMLRMLSNGHFFIYSRDAVSEFGRRKPLTLGTTKYICRHSTSNELSRQIPEMGERGGREILCETSCPIVVEDVILLYNRGGNEVGRFSVLSVDEGETLTEAVAKRFIAVFYLGDPVPAE